MNENVNSLWLGSVRPSVDVVRVPVWDSNHDRKLHDIVVGEGRPLVLVGRHGGSSGRAGAREAGKDLHEAARGLTRRAGFDVTDLLPPVGELVEMLLASGNVVASVDEHGRQFKNRFCLLDYSHLGLIASLSTGRAHRVDNGLEEPHVRWIRSLMRQLRPAGLFVSQFHRVSRGAWQTSLLIEELRRLEESAGSVWACDDSSGQWSIGEGVEIMRLLRSQQASLQARAFARRARRA